MLDIRIENTTAPKAKPDMSKVSFGTTFTDHMFLMYYSSEQGWHDPRIVPYGPLPIEPSAAVLNYAMNVFEGLKAYRTSENKIQLFRPDCNIERMNNSAERLSLPQLDPADALQAIKTLVELDKDWVPSGEGESLYIRPIIMSVEPDVSLHCTDRCLFVVILSPVGCYYKTGLKPVSIAIETEDARTVRGGTGYAKCGGNYAAAQRAGMRAEAQGISQVLWLDGASKQYIEEVGSMNVMFKINGEVITPTLETGTVLPGVTRRSIIQLLKDEKQPVTERLFSVEEFVKAVEAGVIEEAWGCGTAAVVSPIGKLIYNGKEYVIGDGSIGTLTQKLYDELTGIQWGRVADSHNWIVPVC
ncbi:MAG: branched-chain amino acid aminotransferase [Oscillospiraceae bacterium]|nr:branched-chain amino acid aminotransferase [Oscillospiraceae bacterium]